MVLLTWYSDLRGKEKGSPTGLKKVLSQQLTFPWSMQQYEFPHSPTGMQETMLQKLFSCAVKCCFSYVLKHAGFYRAVKETHWLHISERIAGSSRSYRCRSLDTGRNSNSGIGQSWCRPNRCCRSMRSLRCQRRWCCRGCDFSQCLRPASSMFAHVLKRTAKKSQGLAVQLSPR